jgi:transposase
VRRLLHRQGISFKITKTWKESPDPDFEKKNRILKLYEKAPPKSTVLCYDEWGPLELKPIHGYHWSKKGKSERLRATYRRTSGTEQMLAFYDVHKDCLVGTIHKRKQIRDVLTAFKMLRRSYPKSVRLYVIMDNLPLHKSKILMEYYKQNNIVPIWTPTYASWLNIIEGHFSPLKIFTLTVSDDTNHLIRRNRIYKY